MISMIGNEKPIAKFRPRYAGRRVEDKAVYGGELTHPYDRDVNTGTVNYEQLPLMSEVILDFGRFLNRLVRRELDGKFESQTADREDLLSNLNEYIYDSAGMVVAPLAKQMLDPTSPFSSAYTPWNVMGDNPLVKSTMMRVLNSDTTTISGLTNNQYAQLLVAGKINNKRTDIASLGLHCMGNPSSMFDDVPAGNSSIKTNVHYADWAKNEGSETLASAANSVFTDFVAAGTIHSSALSFILAHKDELINIASQTQYLSSELVGFYEKGLKGDFLRHYSKQEIALMFSLMSEISYSI